MTAKPIYLLFPATAILTDLGKDAIYQVETTFNREKLHGRIMRVDNTRDKLYASMGAAFKMVSLYSEQYVGLLVRVLERNQGVPAYSITVLHVLGVDTIGAVNF